MKGTEGGFGLFEEGIIASTLDHVQRPAVPRARTLGHTEPRLEVMTAPDQGRRHFDPPEDILRDGTHPYSGIRLRRAAFAVLVRAHSREYAPKGSKRSAIWSRNPSKSMKHCARKRSRVRSVGRAM